MSISKSAQALTYPRLPVTTSGPHVLVLKKVLSRFEFCQTTTLNPSGVSPRIKVGLSQQSGDGNHQIFLFKIKLNATWKSTMDLENLGTSPWVSGLTMHQLSMALASSHQAREIEEQLKRENISGTQLIGLGVTCRLLNSRTSQMHLASLGRSHRSYLSTGSPCEAPTLTLL